MESGIETIINEGLPYARFMGNLLGGLTIAYFGLIIPMMIGYAHLYDKYSDNSNKFQGREQLKKDLDIVKDLIFRVDIWDFARQNFSRTYRESGKFKIKYPYLQDHLAA